MSRPVEDCLWLEKTISGLVIKRDLSDDKLNYMSNWYTVDIDGKTYTFDVRELAPGDIDTPHIDIIKKAIEEDRLKTILRPYKFH
jgi:hypothetical protein